MRNSDIVPKRSDHNAQSDHIRSVLGVKLDESRTSCVCRTPCRAVRAAVVSVDPLTGRGRIVIRRGHDQSRIPVLVTLLTYWIVQEDLGLRLFEAGISINPMGVAAVEDARAAKQSCNF